MFAAIRIALVSALLVVAAPFANAQASTITTSTTSTSTVIEAPNQFGINTAMPLRIQVTNVGGASAPTGTVTLQDDLGRALTTVPLQPTNNGGYSWAIINWSTERFGLNQLRAVYNPASSSFAASQSTLAGIFILETTPLVVIRMPDRFVVGTQAYLTALVNPASGGGSAVLQVNNRQVYNSTPVSQTGEISFPWTPTASTQYTFVIDYTNRDGTDSAQMRQSVFAFQR